MNEPSRKLVSGSKQVVKQLHDLLSRKTGPVVVALDGGSGAGKSTLAGLIKNELDVALIPLDDFFAANIPDSTWDTFTVQEKLRLVFDWQRLRDLAIFPLLQGQPARWHAFDFHSGLRHDGTYGMEKEPKIVQPANVILIEGAYSASPELGGLIDFTILIDVPVHERHARLEAREPRDFLEHWHRRWDEVEAHYFNHVRPKSSFDFVLPSE